MYLASTSVNIRTTRNVLLFRFGAGSRIRYGMPLSCYMGLKMFVGLLLCVKCNLPDMVN